MYTLLAMALVLHPMRIDESVHSQLREKFADRMLRMQKGDVQEFEQSYQFACPKFLSPVPPNYDTTTATFNKVWVALFTLLAVEIRKSYVHFPLPPVRFMV